METPKYIVRIPELCHEDWNKMTPDNKGRFCNSCSKSVVDFTDKTDQEIVNILQSANGERVCGHFRKSQVDRPLILKVNLKQLPGNMSATRIFAIALLMVFGSVLVSCYDHKNEKIVKLEVVEQNRNENGPVITGALPAPFNVSTEDSVKTEVFEQGQMLMGDVATECIPPLTNGEAIIEPKMLPDKMEYLQGKVKVMNDSTPEVQDSTIAGHRMKGEIVIKMENADTTKTPRSIQEKNIEHGYLGGAVVMISTVAESDSSKVSDTKARENLFIVYPNPNKGEFILKYEVQKRADVRVDLLSESGSLIRTIVNVAGQYEGKYQIPVSASDVPNGTYLVTKTSNGEKETKRVIVEK
jgi:hypothetical protein